MPDDLMRYDEIAKLLLAGTDHNGVRTIHFWKERFWVWSREHPAYRPVHEDGMIDMCLNWMREHNVSSVHREAENVMHCLRAETRLPDELQMPCWLGGRVRRHHWYIALQNGLVDPVALARGLRGAIQQHTPQWFSSTLLSFAYDANAECPLWHEFREAALEQDEQRNALLNTFFGYWITPDTSRHAALFLFGDEGTGKSTVAGVASALLGRNNCSFLPLDEFADSHALPELLGKLLNISDETSSLSKKAVAMFKILSTGREFSANEKHVKRFTAKPTARLLVCVNEWPKIADTTGATWRRIYVLPMQRKIDRGSQDSGLSERLATELPGIFNWAVQGLRMLLDDGFPECDAGERIASDQRTSQQPEAEFVRSSYELSANGWVSTKSLCAAYAKWRAANAAEERSDKTLTASVLRNFPSAKTHRRRVGGVQVRGIMGITEKGATR